MKSNKEKTYIRQLLEVTGKNEAQQAPTGASPTVIDTPKPIQKGGFANVAGMDELKLLVRNSFINVLNNPECAKAYGITPPSMLFYGPPGCGKSFFAEQISAEVNIGYMKICAEDIASQYIHGTQQKIAEVFDKAEKSAPIILFLDEFETMAPTRTTDDRYHQNGETNEFLCRLNNASEKGVYVIAATNHPESIDKAVLRSGRLSEIIYIDMPDAKARESLFRLELSKLPVVTDINYVRLAELTQGYNCSDIAYIVKVAARQMFNASILEKDQPYKVITQSVLEESIARKSPSVSSRDLKEFERIRNEFSPKDKGCKPMTIGFH